VKYPPYPAYKPSGIEWLGKVPEHWKEQKFSREVRIGEGQVDPELELFASMLLIAPNHIESGSGRLLFKETAADQGAISGKYLCKKSDVLYSKIRPALAKATIAPKDCLCSADMYPLDGKPGYSNRYLCWFLLSQLFTSWSVLEADRVAMPKINRETLTKLYLPGPPILEQHIIANFLDHQASKLDNLIAKQRDLIEKLKEKRFALISRTVTRGLPPDEAGAAGFEPYPKFKDTGIEWIGEVPEHWEVKKVKNIAHIGNGSTPKRENPIYWENGYYPWLNSSVVNKEIVFEAAQFVTPAALEEYHLPRVQPPAVLVGITGQGKTRGLATTLLFEATINQHLVYVKPRETCSDIWFLRRVFDSAYNYLRDESEGSGSTKGAITCDQVSNLGIPWPPSSEQLAIAEFLDQETTKIDKLVTKAEEAVERLLEYRTALITAAVTGKIDVRKNES
jgi:type I restriction enzyme S subunit